MTVPLSMRHFSFGALVADQAIDASALRNEIRGLQLRNSHSSSC